MHKSFNKLLQGYHGFRDKYASGDDSVMNRLAEYGQKPEVMLVACSDSRVDPAIILNTEPGELFIVRNVANIIPPYESDNGHHGTSAALEFASCYLHIKHLIILGHSQCGGISALLNEESLQQNDFITQWVSVVDQHDHDCQEDDFAKKATLCSKQNCNSFPWLTERIENGTLQVHCWFFDIKQGQLSAYDDQEKAFVAL